MVGTDLPTSASGTRTERALRTSPAEWRQPRQNGTSGASRLTVSLTQQVLLARSLASEIQIGWGDSTPLSIDEESRSASIFRSGLGFSPEQVAKFIDIASNAPASEIQAVLFIVNANKSDARLGAKSAQLAETLKLPVEVIAWRPGDPPDEIPHGP